MKSIMISIIGEQPAPILLPIYELNPSHVILLATTRTEKVADRLLDILKEKGLSGKTIRIDPYEVEKSSKLLNLGIRSWEDSKFYFNITGGTRHLSIFLCKPFQNTSSDS